MVSRLSIAACRTVLCVSILLVSAASGLDRSAALLRTGDEHVAGQVIIKLDAGFRGIMPEKLPGMADVCRRLNVRGFEPIARGFRRAGDRSGADLLYLVSFDPSADVRQTVEEFGALTGVTYAVPNALIPLPGYTDEVPDDPRYTDQWYLPRIRAPQAWDVTHGDSSVIVAVIDDGLCYDHEDIAANIWVNPAEDLNHNRRLDLQPPPDGDLDGIDQDGNGYADDVIGYDFLDNDPDPLARVNDEHGTHGWGVANAVTDNGIGIAAPSWNVRGMALRCGSGGNIDLAAAIAGTYYAIDNGAWVVSMGWGTRTSYPPLAAACASVWTAGRLTVASAGSQSGSEPLYPAAHPDVIAVAASDLNDFKAPFSAYGTWIDLCAPGIDILSTVGASNYVFWSGTAGATQLAAGVLCWLKSADPDVTNDSALALLLDLCDSMPDPMYPQGLLGAGRLAMVPDSLTWVEESRQLPGIPLAREPTIVRGVLVLQGDRTQNTGHRAELLDISGRGVLDLRPGANDVSRLAPGVYFARSETGNRPQRVMIAR